MRTTRILAAALALPALTATGLLTLPGSASAATPTALQTLTAYCSQVADDPAPQSSTTSRVSLNESRTADDRHAGFADASTLSAGAFTRAERNAFQPEKENCETRVGFRNTVTIRPGTSGLATGDPVTLTAIVALDAELSSTLDYTKASSALSELDATIEVTDLAVPCDGFGCENGAVYFDLAAQRTVDNVDPANVDQYGDQDGGLSRYERVVWSANGNEWNFQGENDDASTVVCPSFPCSGGAEGPASGPMPALPVHPDVEPITFTTTVGATLDVKGTLVAYTAAAYGTTTASSDGTTVDLDITDNGTGVEIVVGSTPADTTKPTTGSTVDVAPNANGWNDGPVTVTLTAQDETALAGISYTTSTGRSETGTSPLTVTVSDPGTTVLTWTATDVAGNTAGGSRTLKIDTQDPSLDVPLLGVSAPAGPNGTADVTFFTPHSDDLSGSSVSCTPASGSTFPLGETTVVCTAVDGAGNDTSKQFVVTVTQPTTVAGYLTELRALISTSPMDEVLRGKLLNDLALLEKAYEKGRGATKGCKELGDLQLRVAMATSMDNGTKAAILEPAGELGELLGC